MTAQERLKGLSHLCHSDLIKALRGDLSDVVRHEAAFLITQFAYLDDTVKGLCDAAKLDPSILVRHEACLSLAKFKTKLAFDTLADCMADKSPEVVSSARYALEEMVFGPSVDQELIDKLRTFVRQECQVSDANSHEWQPDQASGITDVNAAYRAGMWYAYRRVENLLPLKEKEMT